jgi:hypothetical protein
VFMTAAAVISVTSAGKASDLASSVDLRDGLARGHPLGN